MHLPSVIPWKHSQICPECKPKKSSLLSGDPDFISWNFGSSSHTTCSAHTAVSIRRQSSWVSSPQPIHLQWLSDRVWQRNKEHSPLCLLRPGTLVQKARNIPNIGIFWQILGNMPKNSTSSQLCCECSSASPHPDWDKRGLMRPRNLLWLRQEKGTSVHRSEREASSQRQYICFSFHDLTQLHLKNTFLCPLPPS